MMFQIRIAGMCIEVHGTMESTRDFCRGYLVQDQVPDLTLYMEKSDLEMERRIQKETERKPNGNEDPLFADSVLEPLALYRKIVQELLRFDTFLMHGTVAAIGDAAFMYTASSGTGKTTRARKFLEVFPSAYIVNGDKPLLKIVQVDQNGKISSNCNELSESDKQPAARSEVLACGTPWCGKERMQVDRLVPLKAIFLLERSDENRIQEVSIIDAFPVLYQQTFRPKDPALLNQTLKLIRRLSESVRFYRLACNREADAARLVYRTIFER